MNSKQLTDTVNNVSKTLKWEYFFEGKNQKEVKAVEQYARFKRLNKVQLLDAIESLKTFDINLIWERSFWKLKNHESICAVASELYNTIKKLRAL